MEISHIVARQILDSRGNPTIEADVWLTTGVFGRASVPSGASTGAHEAHELRDSDMTAFGGKGVSRAIQNIHERILPAIKGKPADDQASIDQLMIELDGSENKGNLGANAILAVSLATAHAAAKARGVLLYTHINDLAGNPQKSLPLPMFNILNGGIHAHGSTDIQESMVVPVGAQNYKHAIQMGTEVFHALKKVLEEKNYTTTVGDEGGFAPHLVEGNKEGLQLLVQAITAAGYIPGKDLALALDIASSELFQNSMYNFVSESNSRSMDQMVKWYGELSQEFPIVSIEDGLQQDDWTGWQLLTSTYGQTLQLVGDDLLVTSPKRLRYAIDLKAANAILIKPNQIGTLTETIEAVKVAKEAGWRTIISHRSGETEDTTIAHIAVGLGAEQIKTGSLSRSERTAKHNELLRIEEIDKTLLLAHPLTF